MKKRTSTTPKFWTFVKCCFIHSESNPFSATSTSRLRKQKGRSLSKPERALGGNTAMRSLSMKRNPKPFLQRHDNFVFEGLPRFPLSIILKYWRSRQLDENYLYMWTHLGIYFNPSLPSISMHILYTGLYKFPSLLTRRICLAVKSLFTWL